MSLSPLLSLVVVVFVPVFACRRRSGSATASSRPAGTTSDCRARSPASSTRRSPACASSRRSPRRIASSTASIDRAHELYQSRMRTARFNARYSSTLQALPMLGQLGVLAVGGWLALDGHITLGVFLAFASYLVQIITPVRLVSSMLATTPAGPRRRRAGVRAARPASRAVTDAPDARPVVEPPRRRSSSTTSASATATGRPVAARHLADDPARRADRARRRVGLGQDHAGLPDRPLLRPDAAAPSASTAPTSASFTLDVACARRSNVVFEESFLFSTTIRENIAFARPDASDAEIEAAARVAQAHDFILELSHGYDTVVGERGFTLSGGQRQRIALARAALANPQVLVLDDATSAIDARHRGGDPRVARRRSSGTRTTVLIAHRSSTLRLADRVHRARRRPHRRRGHQRRAVAHVGALPRAARPAPSSTPPAHRSGRSSTHVDPARLAARRRRRRRRGDPARRAGDAASPAWRRGRRRELDRSARRARRGDARAAGPGRGAAAAARRSRRRPRRGHRAATTAVEPAPALLRRFRWALLVVAALVVRRRRHDAGRAAADPPRPRQRRRSCTTRATLVAMCIAFLAVQLLSWGNQIVELLHTSRTAERMLYTLRARDVRPPPAAVARLLRQGDGRADHDPHDHRRRGAGPAAAAGPAARAHQHRELRRAWSVILLVLDVRLALAAFIVLPVLAVLDRLVPARSRRSYLRARDADLDRQRRAAGERRRRPRHPVARPRRQQRGALHALARSSTATPACVRCS